MSLISTLLLKHPIQLPKGRVRSHNPDNRKRPMTNGQQENADRNEAVRLANVERIYEAIADSPKPLSLIEIEKATALSMTTCFRGVGYLEDWEGGPRITRIRGPKHKFEVKK